MAIDEETTDVLVAGYRSAHAAHEDYEAVRTCGARLWGAVVVSKDLKGNVSLEQTDHTVEEVAAGAAGVGLVVGLFAPPLLAATAIGAVIGAVAGKALHHKIGSQVEAMAEETIPIGCRPDRCVSAQGGGVRRCGRDAGDPEGSGRGRRTSREGTQGALADAQQKLAAGG